MTAATDSGLPEFFDFFDKKLYQHDGFDKTVFRDPRNAQEVVRWMFKKHPKLLEKIDFDNITVSDESYLDEELRESHVDVLYKIPLLTGMVLTMFILIELKTRSEKFTMYQVLRYILRIWDAAYQNAKKLGNLATFMFPLVFPAIIYHGDRHFTAPTNLDDLQDIPEGLEEYSLKLNAILWDLSVLPESEKPEDLELSASFSAMQGVFEKDVDARLLEIYRSLFPHFEDDDRFLTAWMRIFWYAITSSKSFTEEKCKETISEINKIRGNEMSTIEAPMYLIDVLEARGRNEGIALGEARERQRQIANIFTTLRKNCHVSQVPADIVEELHNRQDIFVLESLFEDSLECTSLDEFRQKL